MVIRVLGWEDGVLGENNRPNKLKAVLELGAY